MILMEHRTATASEVTKRQKALATTWAVQPGTPVEIIKYISHVSPLQLLKTLMVPRLWI